MSECGGTSSKIEIDISQLSNWFSGAEEIDITDLLKELKEINQQLGDEATLPNFNENTQDLHRDLITLQNEINTEIGRTQHNMENLSSISPENERWNTYMISLQTLSNVILRLQQASSWPELIGAMISGMALWSIGLWCFHRIRKLLYKVFPKEFFLSKQDLMLREINKLKTEYQLLSQQIQEVNDRNNKQNEHDLKLLKQLTRSLERNVRLSQGLLFKYLRKFPKKK